MGQHMIGRGEDGKIVNISSIAGLASTYRQGNYVTPSRTHRTHEGIRSRVGPTRNQRERGLSRRRIQSPGADILREQAEEEVGEWEFTK